MGESPRSVQGSRDSHARKPRRTLRFGADPRVLSSALAHTYCTHVRDFLAIRWDNRSSQQIDLSRTLKHVYIVWSPFSIFVIDSEINASYCSSRRGSFRGVDKYYHFATLSNASVIPQSRLSRAFSCSATCSVLSPSRAEDSKLFVEKAADISGRLLAFSRSSRCTSLCFAARFLSFQEPDLRSPRRFLIAFRAGARDQPQDFHTHPSP